MIYGYLLKLECHSGYSEFIRRFGLPFILTEKYSAVKRDAVNIALASKIKIVETDEVARGLGFDVFQKIDQVIVSSSAIQIKIYITSLVFRGRGGLPLK